MDIRGCLVLHLVLHRAANMHAAKSRRLRVGGEKEKEKENGGKVIFRSVTHDSTLAGLLNGTRDP